MGKRNFKPQPGDTLRGMAYIEAYSIPEPNTGCWLWIGALSKDGYGHVHLFDVTESRAHRYALILTVGPIGKLYALHRCDQRSCVNPAHLFAGTAADNSNDMKAKGRATGPKKRRYFA